MILSLIVAIGKNRVIGKGNQMMWRLPLEFKYFKETTIGHTIISGRKNYEAIGSPLPKRNNIVVTRNKDYQPEGILVAHSLDEAISKAKEIEKEEIFICGGGEIYRQSLELVDRLYITEVDFEQEGDVYFPEFDEAQFKKTLIKEEAKSEKNPLAWKAYLYQRIS